MVKPAVEKFKHLTTTGAVPRGPLTSFPIQEVESFTTVDHIFSTKDDLSALPESTVLEILEAAKTGLPSQENPGSVSAKLATIGVLNVTVIDWWAHDVEIEWFRDGDSFTRIFSSLLTQTTDLSGDDLDPNVVVLSTMTDAEILAITPNWEMEPILIHRLENASTYKFRIRVVDDYGNRSDWSNAEVYLDYVAGGDTPPTAPVVEIVHNYAEFTDDTY